MNTLGKKIVRKPCPVCKEPVQVRNNGKFALHKTPRTRSTCPGSGKPA